MIKVMWFLKRAPHLSLEEFAAWWLTRHAPDIAADQAPYLKRHVIDVRNLGIVGGIEMEPREGKPTARAYEAFQKCYDAGLPIRTTGDIIALSPPLIIEKNEIDFMVETIGDVLKTVN